MAPVGAAGRPLRTTRCVYTTNALDCLNLIALAAVQAGTDDPVEIADEMIDVSIVGRGCNSFEQCLGIVEAGPQHQLPGVELVRLLGPQ